MPRVRTILQQRTAALAAIIADEVTRYLAGDPRRRCATCGRLFHPVHRWHFFCAAVCRAFFYRGQFRPRKAD